MIDIMDIKKKVDDNSLSINSLSIEEILLLCDEYEKQIDEIDERINERNIRLETKKNKIRRDLDYIRKVNKERNLYSSNQESYY